MEKRLRVFDNRTSFIFISILTCSIFLFGFKWRMLHRIAIESVSQDLLTFPENDVSKVDAFFNNYVGWHSSVRKCIVQRNCPGEEPKLVVWQCPARASSKCAGIGDRLRGIQFALLLAIITKRVFFVDWPDEPYPVETALQPSSIDWRLPKNFSHDKLEKLAWFSCRRPLHKCTENGHMPHDEDLPVPLRLVGKRHLNITSDDIDLIFRGLPSIALTTRARPQSIYRFLGNFGILRKYPQFVDRKAVAYAEKNLLKLLFSPSVSVKERLNYVFPPQIAQTPYVSVHVRLGVDIEENNSGRFKEISNKIASVCETMLQCAQKIESNPSMVVFLASDSATLKERFQSIGRRENISVFFSDGPVLHVGRPVKHFNQFEADTRWLLFLQVFVDLFGLAGGKVLLINGSGFGRMARNFGNDIEFVNMATSERPTPDLKHCILSSYR